MPTLSVGNLAAGGTGKTPFLFETLRRLQEEDWKCGVLSRGYGGDEGQMLQSRFPKLVLVEDVDRVRGLAALQTSSSPDVLLLDDAFQHLRLARDLDVVLLDATCPFGRCLPAGLFRESPSALRRADCVILSRADQVSPQCREQIWQKVDVARGDRPPLPRMEGGVVATRLRNVATQESAPIEDLRGQQAWVACGIGNPQSFLALCQDLGVSIVGTSIQRDHFDWPDRALEGWAQRDRVLVTEKDGVKLQGRCPDSVWEILVDWKFTCGESSWQEFLEAWLLPIRAARIEPLWQAHLEAGRGGS